MIARTAGALAALAAAAATAAAAPCVSTVDATYTLPDTPLTALNPWLAYKPDYAELALAGCDASRDDGEVCFDKPAIGSGLAYVGPNYFLGLTDRGPNQDCEDLADLDPVKYADAVGKSGKGFPVADFAPTIMHFTFDEDSKSLVQKHVVPLLDQYGYPITGLSNTAFDDTPYGKDCKGEPLAYDPSGLDTEDLAIIPGTDYVAIVDEYSPSLVIANYKTGIIVARHVPENIAPMLADAKYPIIGDIPSIFSSRRKNRGFEAVVVDAEGKYVIAILQSPMLGDDSDSTEQNSVIRAAYFSVIEDCEVPTLEYTKSFVIEASLPSAYMNSENRPKDMKYSGAQYYGKNKFIALERAKSQVKLFLVDFSDVTNLDTTMYADNLGLEMESHKGLSASQVNVVSASKTLIWESTPGVGGTVGFDGSSKQEGFIVDPYDSTKLYIMDDNDFALEGNGAIELRKISLGRSVDGASVCPTPEHPMAPTIDVNPSKVLSFGESSTYRISDEPGAGSAENFDVNEAIGAAYVANDDTGKIDVYNITTSPASPIGSYDPASEFPSGDFKPTSASVCKVNGAVAVGLAAGEDEDVGKVIVLAADGSLALKIEEDCYLPDHVKWSDDCKFLVVACEGEGASIPGGVLVADFNGPEGMPYRGAKVAGFEKYDPKAAELEMVGVRLVESKIPSVDLEPEYVAIYGKNAFVAVQEANAIAVVDMHEAVITELKPIGFIDRSKPGFALDASNKDSGIEIRNYNHLYGMPQPDTIVAYTAGDGETYLIFANEGDAKDDEEFRGADITDPEELGRNAIDGLKENVEDKELLGRLKFSSVMGYNNETNTQESMFHFGSRSFSIMALDGTIVFDSGEWFARIQEAHFPKIFNANGFDDEDLSESQADLMDNRSDDKGMEPESLSVMYANGSAYAFIGFERSSIIVLFDVTDPKNPTFVDAAQNHPVDDPIDTVFAEGRQGDLDPEGLFASASFKKLFVSGSVSNTVSAYEILGLE